MAVDKQEQEQQSLLNNWHATVTLECATSRDTAHTDANGTFGMQGLRLLANNACNAHTTYLTIEAMPDTSCQFDNAIWQLDQ